MCESNGFLIVIDFSIGILHCLASCSFQDSTRRSGLRFLVPAAHQELTAKESIMYWSHATAGNLNAASKNLWTAFGDDAGKIIDALIFEPALATDIAAFMRRRLKLPCNFDLARQIMGKNFFGPKEAVEHFGVTYGAKERCDLGEIPFMAETLEANKDTHVLIAAPEMSLSQFMQVMRERGFGHLLPAPTVRIANAEFAKTSEPIAWRLIRKTPVPESLAKYPEQQRALLKPDEYVPPLRDMVSVIVGYYLTTSEHLFGDVRVNCREYDAPFAQPDIVQPVTVGHFGPKGLYIGSTYWLGGNDLGLASAIMPIT